MVNPLEGNSGLGDETLRPEKLFRAFTVRVSDLSPELFEVPLVPGSGADTEGHKMIDGNELGVYMTTNERVSNTAYAHSVDRIKCPRYNSGRGIIDFIELPMCGITFEIDTKDLAIRKPVITPQLMGLYNNGFIGDEWIADQVPPSNYRVTRLTLSTHPTDSSRVVRVIRNADDLGLAIHQIQGLYAEKLATAEDFVEFLKSLDVSERLNEFSVKRLWGQHLKNKSTSKSEN